MTTQTVTLSRLFFDVFQKTGTRIAFPLTVNTTCPENYSLNQDLLRQGIPTSMRYEFIQFVKINKIIPTSMIFPDGRIDVQITSL